MNMLTVWSENMMTMYINTWEKMLKYVDATKYNNNILRVFKFQLFCTLIMTK